VVSYQPLLTMPADRALPRRPEMVRQRNRGGSNFTGWLLSFSSGQQRVAKDRQRPRLDFSRRAAGSTGRQGNERGGFGVAARFQEGGADRPVVRHEGDWRRGLGETSLEGEAPLLPVVSERVRASCKLSGELYPRL
ncbi:hypothetical protein FRC00_002032, partial [Tulasnella sp. 408]